MGLIEQWCCIVAYQDPSKSVALSVFTFDAKPMMKYRGFKKDRTGEWGLAEIAMWTLLGIPQEHQVSVDMVYDKNMWICPIIIIEYIIYY